MKKILALALAFCMMLAAAPFVFAEDACDCGDPDCTEACTCDPLTCLGDCCDPAEPTDPADDPKDFFQQLIDFFTKSIGAEIKRLFERIIESIFGPSFPFEF